ncbi:MAG: AAA domain-containing protein [Acidobacteriota bacterium]
MNELSEPHLAQLDDALVSLFSHERGEHERILGLSLPERVSLGLCWGPLRVVEIERAGRGRSRVLLRSVDGSALHDGIDAGTPVLLAPAQDDSGGEGRRGSCLGSDGAVAEILTEEPHDSRADCIVTRRLDDTTTRRYRSALRRAQELGGPLVEALLGRLVPEQDERPPKDLSALDGLNDAQRAAAEAALTTSPLALIHGPPGTGKTHLIVALLRAHLTTGGRALALADSNAAVDHLTLRAHEAGLPVVRLGHPMRIGSSIQPLTLAARIEGGPLGRVIGDVDAEIAELAGDFSRHGRAQRKTLFGERDRLADQAREAVFAECRVIASTLGTIGAWLNRIPPSELAIVDEATQAIEPAAWTVATACPRLVLVGDPHQLGPVVKQPGNPLERSLLQRLLDDTELPLPMLTTQHRMNAAIQDLVQPTYDDALVPHSDVRDGLLRDDASIESGPLTDTSLLFIDTAGAGFTEERDEVTLSLHSAGERRLVAAVVRRLRAAGVPPEDIGIITPYSAQVSRLSAEKDLVGCEVATVNAFQGREKDAVVCSFVRSNDEGELGFVADRRRLTVAVTRARRFLCCVGDSGTLSSSDDFARVIDAFQAAEAWSSAWDEPWSEVLG